MRDRSSGEPATDFGVRFESDNERSDLERWRNATDAERSAAIVELMRYAEGIAGATGIRNDQPAPRLPARSEWATEADGA